MITNQQFNDNIEEFILIMLANLKLKGTDFEFSVNNNYVNKWNIGKMYSFVSVSVKQLRIDFTISFDDLYGVPLLNMRLYDNDMFLTSPMAQRTLAVGICPVDLHNHHLLQQPWLQVHPCETLQTIDSHLKNTPICKYNLVIQYLCCWFGLYGLPSIFPQFSVRPNIYINNVQSC